MIKKEDTIPQICHDCRCKEGELHMLGCDMEKCPFCGGQLISCNCRYELLGFKYDFSHPTCGLPKEIYENGLPADLNNKWLQILENMGRVPYIVYPIICARCGKLWPEFFRIPDDEWGKYIRIDKRDVVLCKDCYSTIKGLIDTYTPKK